MDFKFSVPTTIEVGRGISGKIGEFLESMNTKKLFIVTDKGVRNAGVIEKIEQSLQQSSILYEIFDECIPNPSSESIMTGVEKVKTFNPDCILAVGGGSSIDTAKGMTVMARNAGDILDYEGVGKVPDKGLSLIVIPTTAGTGSEVTGATIVTNSRTHFKAAVISPYLFPDYALLDAELTLKLPQEVTAATGMDALTHAIES